MISDSLTLIAHRNEHGLLLGFTLLGSDTSAWVLIEEALLASQGALQSSESNLRRVTAEHLTIQEEERRRIALDLHDGLGQTLSLLKMSIQEMTRLVSEGIKSDTAKHIEHMKAMVTTAVDETRLLSMKLRPALIDDLGIVVTLGWYFRELKVDCPNITFECDIGVKESEVAEPLKIDIFRIVQEASNNSIKHATTDRIKVSLNRQAACIELLVEDFGSGFEVSAASKETGSGRRLGLHSMRERAESSGGKYTLRSRKGLGTSVSVCWPLSGEVGA